MPFSPRKKSIKRKKVIKKVKAIKKGVKRKVKPYAVKELITKRQQSKNERQRAAVLFTRKHSPETSLAAQEACQKLRVTQKRLGRFIFVDRQGKEIQRAKRRNYSRAKGFMVFIDLKGNKKLIKTHTNIAGQPITGVISDHNIFSSKVKVSRKSKLRAKKYFLEKYSYEIESSTIHMRPQYHVYTDIAIQGGKGAVISYYDFADELSAKIATVANRIRRSEHISTVALVIEMHIKFFNKLNKVEKIVPVNMPVIWCRAKGKKLIRRDFAFPVLISVGYSNMVEILNRMGIVLSGSSQYVNRLLKLKRATKTKDGAISYQRRHKRNGRYITKEVTWKKQGYQPIELHSLGAIIKVFRTQ